MKQIDDYVRAAVRDSTRRSYRDAVTHFEDGWGGLLPATADSVAQYLATHAETLSHNTLKSRLAGLSRWHADQGFPDPTKAPIVKQVLKGIKALHPVDEKRAKPLQLDALEIVDQWLIHQAEQARLDQRFGDLLRYTRDRALLLIGFWRGFRSDELVRLTIDKTDVVAGEGMTLQLPRTKTDRQLKGTSYPVPALSKMCPVAAYQDWLAISGLSHGPVFRGIDRWGHLGEAPLNAGSIVPLLRGLLESAGVEDPEAYSSHSLRRGLASWASASGWELQALMEYVGWKDISSAMRYVETADPFQRAKMGLWCKLRVNRRKAAYSPNGFMQPRQLPRFRTEFAPELPDLVSRTGLCECDV